MSGIKRNSLVRIGKGKKVYRVVRITGVLVRLEADAWHPDAAVRLPDALRAYHVDELTRVTS